MSPAPAAHGVSNHTAIAEQGKISAKTPKFAGVDLILFNDDATKIKEVQGEPSGGGLRVRPGATSYVLQQHRSRCLGGQGDSGLALQIHSSSSSSLHPAGCPLHRPVLLLQSTGPAGWGRRGMRRGRSWQRRRCGWGRRRRQTVSSAARCPDRWPDRAAPDWSPSLLRLASRVPICVLLLSTFMYEATFSLRRHRFALLLLNSADLAAQFSASIRPQDAVNFMLWNTVPAAAPVPVVLSAGLLSVPGAD